MLLMMLMHWCCWYADAPVLLILLMQQYLIKMKISMTYSFSSTLLYPVSLLIGYWDWVQGGNPLYPAVKCLSSCWGQIWRIFFISFAKRTWHIQFLAAKIFSGSKKTFIPKKLAIFWGIRHFPKIEGPFPKFTSFDNLFFTQESVWKPSVILLLCLSHLWKLLVPLSWPLSVFTRALIS